MKKNLDMNKGTHLTYAERALIESMLDEGKTNTQIADKLGKHKSTIGKEIRKRRIYIQAFKRRIDHGTKTLTYDCRYIPECGDNPKTCSHICKKTEPVPCKYRDKKGVCNGCPKLNDKGARACKLHRYVYDALTAHEAYSDLKVSSRQGVNLTEEELQKVKDAVSAGVKKGQSIHNIYTYNPDLPVCERTVYNYITQRELADVGVIDMDLPAKTRRKPSKSYRMKELKAKKRKDRKYLIGRTFDDFQEYMQNHPNASVMEMDTVYNRRSDESTFIQTFVSRDPHHLFLAVLHNEKKARSMVEGLRSIKDKVGEKAFSAHFGVILTDRGSEFTDAEGMEALGCRVFYCDPMSSCQKPHVENKHLLLRKIIPSGADHDMAEMGLTSQEKLDLVVSHIDSYNVESLNDNSPYDYFMFIMRDQEFLDNLNIKKIDPADIILKPSLIREKK